MKKVFSPIILLLLFVPVSAYAQDYYVDATNGDNGNLGTSPEQAWKTISRVNSMDFNPGDDILFKRGEVWRERLNVPSSGSAGNPITFGAYGSGAKPRIYASDIITGWTPVSGTVYQVSVSKQVRIVYYNGIRLTENDGATTGVGPNEWDWDSNTLYANVGEDPATGTLEAGQRNICIDTDDKAYLTIKDLDLRHCNSNWEACLFAYQGGDGIVIQNIDVTGSSYYGIWVKGSDNAEVSNCAITECGHWGIRGSSATSSSGIDIFNNTVTSSHTGLQTYDYNNVNIYGNTIYDIDEIGIGVLAQNSDSLSNFNIYNNNISNVGQSGCPCPGIQTGGTTGKTLTNIKVYKNTINGNQAVFGGDSYGIDVDMGSQALVYQNLVYNNKDGGIEFIGAQSGSKVYYNVIYDCGKGVSGLARAGITWGSRNSNGEAYNNVIYDCYRGLAQTSASQSATARNNIVINSIDYHVYNVAGACAPTLDYNCYYPDGAGKFKWQGADSDDFADWQSDSGQDANSINSDPLLVDAVNSDFHLQSTSPCIDAGTDVGLTMDFEGNPVPRGDSPDIGAYEHADEAVCETNTYYVDATNGNDNSDGRCTNTAWKTIGKVNNMSFNPGDDILFKRGEVWREQLTVPSPGSAGNPITFGAYGSGNDPIINGADLLTSWTSESGNLWYVSVSWYNPDQVFFDDTRGDMKSAKGDLADEYDWWYDSVNDRLYVYSASDPGTAYASPGVEAGWRPRGIYINNKDYVTISGIQVEKNRDAGGAAIDVIDSDYVTVKSCIVDEFVTRGVHFYSSDHGVISDNTASTTYDRSVHNHRPVEIGTWEDSNSGCQNITISGNSLSGNPVASKSDGVVIRYSSSVTIDSNTIHDVREYGIDILAGSSDVTVSNNTVYDIGYEGTTIGVIGIEMHGGSSDITVHGNTVYNIFRGLTGIDGVGIFVDVTATNCSVYNNLVHRTDGTGIRVFKTSDADIHHNIVYDCGNNPGKDSQRSAVCVNQGYDINFYNNILSPEEKYGIYLYGTSDIPTHDINVKNNIVYEPAAYAIHVGQYATTDIVSDYNDFYFTSGKCGHRDGTDYNALADWQNGTGQDSNSIDFDPLFINAANGDFHLQPNSPCIDVGIDVGLTLDFEGNPVPQGSAPDIGAYEYASEIPGDLDNDGDVDIEDLILVATNFGKTSGFDPKADVIPNNEIDIYDIVFVASRFS